MRLVLKCVFLSERYRLLVGGTASLLLLLIVAFINQINNNLANFRCFWRMITLYFQDKAAQVTYKSSATLNNVYSNLSNIFTNLNKKINQLDHQVMQI